MQEQVNSIFEGARDRLSNPFVSSFLISFIGFNWDKFYLLFFDTSKTVKWKVQSFSNNEFDLSSPILFAIAFPLISPVLKMLADSWEDFVLWAKTNLQRLFRKKGYVKAEAYFKLMGQLRDLESTAEAREQRIRDLLDTINNLNEKDATAKENKAGQEATPSNDEDDTFQPPINKKASPFDNNENSQKTASQRATSPSERITELSDKLAYSPLELHNFFYGERQTDIQKEHRKTKYSLKKIHVRGKIYGVEMVDNFIRVILNDEKDIFYDHMIHCYFSVGRQEELSNFDIGEFVVIAGQIDNSEEETVDLFDCTYIQRLDEIARESSPFKSKSEPPLHD